jgi:tetratricopeptide (TPR) repeat protein
LAPWVPELAQSRLLVTYRQEPPTSAVLAAYGPLLEYDTSSMRAAIADIHDDDDSVERLSQRICSLNVELCADSAQNLVPLGRTAAAEALWKRALLEARDQIALSTQLTPYVGLLLDRGEINAALLVARRAAAVYSADGLFALAYAEERLGNFDEAIRVYTAIAERYDARDGANAFFVRYGQRHPDGRFSEEIRRATAELFPFGLNRRSLADLRKTGHRGGFIAERQGTRSRRLGMRPGDFVVTVNGYEVRSWQQMDTVLSFDDAPPINVVVFRRGAGLVELSGSFQHLRYDAVSSGPRPKVRPDLRSAH